MKKLLISLLVGTACISSAFATDNAGTVMGGPITTTDCSLLTEDVTINLSNAVFGAYACNTADNIIAVATCHPSGRKGPATVQCSVLAGDDCVATTATDDDPDVGTRQVQGGIAYTGSTQGGRIQGTNAANCTTNGTTTAEAATAAGL